MTSPVAAFTNGRSAARNPWLGFLSALAMQAELAALRGLVERLYGELGVARD